MFAAPHSSEIWVMILEKAMAKMCGSYAAIEGGITEWGIMCMTGMNGWRYYIENGVWTRNDIIPQKDKNDKRECGLHATGEKYDSTAFFKVIQYFHRNGAVLCCGGVTKAGEQQGLITGHAFSLLQVKTVLKQAMPPEYIRMVQLRNPWGKDFWKGGWSDKSPLWDQHSLVKKALKPVDKDDGKFWMCWDDFIIYWGYIGVVDCTTDILNMRPPTSDETAKAGPLKACCVGNCEYWLKCLGPWRLLQPHVASKQGLKPSDFERKCGMDIQGCYCRLCEHEEA